MGRVCDLERSILLIISFTLPGGRNLILSGGAFTALSSRAFGFRRRAGRRRRRRGFFLCRRGGHRGGVLGGSRSRGANVRR